MPLSKQAHTRLQELIVWSTAGISVTSLYFIFVSPPQATAPPLQRVRVRDALAITSTKAEVAELPRASGSSSGAADLR